MKPMNKPECVKCGNEVYDNDAEFWKDDGAFWFSVTVNHSYTLCGKCLLEEVKDCIDYLLNAGVV